MVKIQIEDTDTARSRLAIGVIAGLLLLGVGIMLVGPMVYSHYSIEKYSTANMRMAAMVKSDPVKDAETAADKGNLVFLGVYDEKRKLNVPGIPDFKDRELELRVIDGMEMAAQTNDQQRLHRRVYAYASSFNRELLALMQREE